MNQVTAMMAMQKNTHFTGIKRFGCSRGSHLGIDPVGKVIWNLIMDSLECQMKDDIGLSLVHRGESLGFRIWK